MQYPATASLSCKRPGGFSSLPDELILAILTNLDFRSISSCSSVCRKLNKLVHSSAELCYIIELAVDGLDDCALSSISHRERLQRILDRRKAWASVAWRKSTTLHIPGECKAYELVAGVFAKLTDSHQFISVRLPSVYDDDDESTSESIPDGRRVKLELDFPARDFAIDPTQDLVIFLEDDERPMTYIGQRTIHLHIRTLSSNKAHPLAQSPTITFYIPPTTDDNTNTIQAGFVQIAEDVLVMHYATDSEASRVLLWNWKTGVPWLDREFASFMDFSFISPRAFMLTSIEGHGSIRIYSFKFDSGIFQAVPRVKHIATLSLPELRPDVWFDFFGTHTSPIIAHPPPSKIAVPSLHSQIHVMTIRYVYGGREYPFSLFIPNHTFLSYLENANQAEDEGDGSPLFVPWSDWGPRNTRFMDRPGVSLWLRFVHGHRVVLPPYNHIDLASHQTMMQIYDFNPHVAKTHESVKGTGRRTRTQLNTHPLTIEREIFTERVTTHLVFHETVCSLDGDYSAYMIDDERLVALKADRHLGNDFDDVDVLLF